MIRGEIWWAVFPNPKGSEPGYKRPVLIIQSDASNQSQINTVICVAITSNLALAEAPGNVFLSTKDTNLNKNSVANISQLITLNKSFLQKCIGTINRKSLQQIEDGIKLVLDF